MRTRGIVRRLDELGRIVLRKYEPNCLFCGASKDLKEYHGKQICAKCAKSIGEL